MCGKHLGELDVIGIVTALYRVAKSRDGREVVGDPRLTAMLGAACSSVPEFSLQGLANTAWSMAKLRLCDEPLWAAISASSIPKMQQFRPQALSNTAWAGATLAVQHRPLFESISAASLNNIGEFNAQDLACTAWAFATLLVPDKPLFSAISSASLTRLHDFNPQNLTNPVWAFAKLAVQDSPLMDAISSQSIRKIHSFRPLGLANTAWALATLRLRHLPLLKAIAAEALQKSQAFSPAELTNIVWAFATLNYEDGPLLSALAAAAIPKLSDCSPHKLAIIAWAFAVLKFRDLPLFDAIAAAALSKISEFTAQDLANTVWAFASLGIRHSPLFASIASAAIPKLVDFSMQGCANIAWAFARMGYTSEPLFKAIAAAAIKKLEALTAEDCAARRASTGMERLADVQALILAFAEAQQLEEPLLHAARAALRMRAAAMDGTSEGCLGGLAASADGVRNAMVEEDVPKVLLDLPQLCVLWKPPGWTVSVGNEDDEDLFLNGFQMAGRGDANDRPIQEWVADHLGRHHPITRDVGAQFGLLHRLDRQTSGALLCAKTYRGYHEAQLEFAAHRVRKEYVCLCQGRLSPGPRLIEVPLRLETSSSRRTSWRRRSVPAPKEGDGGRLARTEVREVEYLVAIDNEPFTFAELRLHTGRMHQIRAHLSSEGCPLVGDVAYGGARYKWCPRIFLHASRLCIDLGDGPIDVRSDLPQDLREALAPLKPEASGRA